jgi:hypothetical protein
LHGVTGDGTFLAEWPSVMTHSTHSTLHRFHQLVRGEGSPAGYNRVMTEQFADRDIVYESALQLWAAAQTEFDPYEVPPDGWCDAVVPVRDIDIAIDLDLDLDTVRARLRDLDGRRLVIDVDAGNLSVKAPIPEDRPL